MNKALWIARKNYLCTLIKQVSDGYGGDDIEFVRKHCKTVIEANRSDDIEKAICCYEEMVDNLKFARFWG